MARPRPDIDFILIDDRNAIIFDERNTGYIMACVREATIHPEKRDGLYGEMARKFHIDAGKMNLAVIRYVDRLKRERGRPRPPGGDAEREQARNGTALLDERLLMAELCRRVGHRYVNIELSHKRGFRECERCQKRESNYNL